MSNMVEMVAGHGHNGAVMNPEEYRSALSAHIPPTKLIGQMDTNPNKLVMQRKNFQKQRNGTSQSADPNPTEYLFRD